MRFEDHFSQLASDYARYRPRYSNELFGYLGSLTPKRQLAWDCGTGNGQAAIGLVDYFDRVLATDASSDQISNAIAHPRIEYRVERAEDVSVQAKSVDLVTVAVAVHWFDLDPFYRKVREVLAAQGAIAVWTYHLPLIDPIIDRVVGLYYRHVLAGYWPELFHYVDERYETLPFPFKLQASPPIEMEADWDLGQLLGFLNSWSATHRYEQAHGHHPLQVVWPELERAWGDPEQRRKIRWPLYIRAGIVE